LFQYVQYKARIPDLKEFTLCSWHKFYNHSRNHPIFSYGVRDRPQEIVSWLGNNEHSSFYQMRVSGQTIYRLNYPIRLHRWYHACQSWNGRNGEWQIWVNSERIGRGFHNLVAGRIIKGGGIAITGQEQKQYGGGFADGPLDGGLVGEVTLVQLYRAALTQGKAYTNHKHHHAHKFHHEDELGEDDRAVQQPGGHLPEGVTDYPFLRNMQLVPRLPIEELNVIAQQQRLIQQQQQQHNPFDLLGATRVPGPFNLIVSNVTGDKIKSPKKRTLDQSEFGLIPGIDLSGLFTGEGYVLGAGGYKLQVDGAADAAQSLNTATGEEEKQMEPAEWEVRSIMALCSGCGEDPFRKATVLSWRETSKKVFGGALYIQANQQCHEF
ncbi:hypothetical protein AAG570_005099, partial [Ranatra chinensis]